MGRGERHVCCLAWNGAFEGRGRKKKERGRKSVEGEGMKNNIFYPDPRGGRWTRLNDIYLPHTTFVLPFISRRFTPPPALHPFLSLTVFPSTTVCSSTPFFPIPFPLFSFSVFSLLLPRFLKNYEHRSREMQRNHSRDDVFDRVRVYTFNERLFVGF